MNTDPNDPIHIAIKYALLAFQNNRTSKMQAGATAIYLLIEYKLLTKAMLISIDVTIQSDHAIRCCKLLQIC